MIDIEKVLPKESGEWFESYKGTFHGEQAEANDATLILVLTTISNNLERIAVAQESLVKGGEEATKKADSTFRTVMGLVQGMGSSKD